MFPLICRPRSIPIVHASEFFHFPLLLEWIDKFPSSIRPCHSLDDSAFRCCLNCQPNQLDVHSCLPASVFRRQDVSNLFVMKKRFIGCFSVFRVMNWSKKFVVIVHSFDFPMEPFPKIRNQPIGRLLNGLNLRRVC